MDIVERLRELSTWDMPELKYAANEIERLRKEELQTAIDLRHATLGEYMMMGCRVGELEDALQEIYDLHHNNETMSEIERNDRTFDIVYAALGYDDA